jgi:hypothetical protein
MKKCFKCGVVKPLSEYYKHSQMKDGYLNKCVTCSKKDAAAHRENNLDRIRAYDRARGNRQDSDYVKEYRLLYPNKYKAHTLVGNAIRGKKLFKKPCEVCGEEKTVGHHDDYLEPLNVRWMCQAHHKQWHSKNGEGLNPA